MKVLVTGGAGYVGTTLVPMLLSTGHQVTVLDCLLYGADGLAPLSAKDENVGPLFKSRKTFQLVPGDIRNRGDLDSAARDCDAIVHLAAIVGYPACNKQPKLAEETNVQGSRNVAAIAGGRPIIYASTESSYGIVKDRLCTEDIPLNPLSLYARTKADAEKILVEKSGATAYRIATAFGFSPRLRLDLLINEFVHRAIHEGRLEVYEGSAWRSFIHVRDIARGIIFALKNQSQMQGKVFNLGSEKMNATKTDICLAIQRRLPEVQIITDPTGHDPDQRNYAISYAKISALGYTTQVTLEQGIDELANKLRGIPDRSRFTNAAQLPTDDMGCKP